MSRKDIISSPEYWTAKVQIDLYNCAEEFMKSNNLNRTQLAQHLGVSKGYVSQLLNGDYDHKLSKLVELAISFGVVPQIEFKPIEDVIAEDNNIYHKPKWLPCINYIAGYARETPILTLQGDFESISSQTSPNVA